MAAVGVPFHAATTSSSSMAYLPACQSHGSSFSTSPSLDDPVFDLSDFVILDQAEFVAPARAAVPSLAVDGGRDLQNSSLGNLIGNSSGTNTNARYRSGGGVLEGGGGREITSRIAFRMKSEVEILDDGFKWRKYGKKSVKNSPNPRNYYRCSTEGCRVKKRVERDREDPSYVITTYEGTHNHMSPDVVYYTTQDAVSGRYYVAGCSRMPTPASN